MKNVLLTIALLTFASAATAQPAPTALPAAPSVAGIQPQIIDLSLVEALVAIKHTELAGIFGFVPEPVSALAFADYLMRDLKSLKCFIKKVEKDKKLAEGISIWDKQVLLHLVTIDATGDVMMGVRKVSKELMEKVNTLGLAQDYPLEMIVQRRAGK
jgi:hypothetical protein